MVLRHLRPLDGAPRLDMTEREAIAALAGVVAARMFEPEEGEAAHEGLPWVVRHFFTSEFEEG